MTGREAPGTQQTISVLPAQTNPTYALLGASKPTTLSATTGTKGVIVVMYLYTHMHVMCYEISLSHTAKSIFLTFLCLPHVFTGLITPSLAVLSALCGSSITASSSTRITSRETFSLSKWLYLRGLQGLLLPRYNFRRLVATLVPLAER